MDDVFSGRLALPHIWDMMFPLPDPTVFTSLSVWEIRTRTDWLPIITRLALGLVCRGSTGQHWPFIRPLLLRRLLRFFWDIKGYELEAVALIACMPWVFPSPPEPTGEDWRGAPAWQLAVVREALRPDPTPESVEKYDGAALDGVAMGNEAYRLPLLEVPGGICEITLENAIDAGNPAIVQHLIEDKFWEYSTVINHDGEFPLIASGWSIYIVTQGPLPVVKHFFDRLSWNIGYESSLPFAGISALAASNTDRRVGPWVAEKCRIRQHMRMIALSAFREQQRDHH